MGNPEAHFPVESVWENRSLRRKLRAGFRVLFGLNRGGRNFPVFPDDTFLVSYPRSGNTWTRFLVANLIFGETPTTFANVEERIPDPSAVRRRDLAKVPRPRIVKSHEYFDPRYRKVIYIVRDPREVVLSNYYFQLKKRFIPEGYPMDQYIARFVGEGVDSYAPWGENVASWLGTRGSAPGFMLLKYEDMVEHPEQELSRIASFLGVEVAPQRLAQAVELSSVNHMRDLEKAESSKWNVTKNTRKDVPFVRSARVDSWKANLSREHVAMIESAWGNLMSCLGYALMTRNQSEIVPGSGVYRLPFNLHR